MRHNSDMTRISVESAGEAVDRRSQADRVRTALRARILRAELKPGSIILEPQLAEEHGVSKTPVREALQMLVGEGFVTVLPRKGYMVSGLNYQDISEVMALRLIVEPPLFNAAAKNVTDDVVKQLQSLMEDQFDSNATFDQRVNSAMAFHLTCVRTSQNAWAVTIVQRLVEEITRLHYLLPSLEMHLTSDAERSAHQQIIDALAAADGAAAETAIREHLVESNTAMVGSFFEGGLSTSV
jgi:DNA-binding GntR family transcriptional regulator